LSIGPADSASKAPMGGSKLVCVVYYDGGIDLLAD
jgi:hypothetical protein